LKRVLVVDDDPDLSSGLARLLSDQYEVLIAADGEAALQILQRESVDVIVLDMLMPLLDGHEVLKRLRAQGAKPRIIAVSARPDLISRSLELGADDSLAKPFTISDLERRIEGLLREGGTRNAKAPGGSALRVRELR
jgi:two-component system, OmpR family, response regulator MprA